MNAPREGQPTSEEWKIILFSYVTLPLIVICVVALVLYCIDKEKTESYREEKLEMLKEENKRLREIGNELGDIAATPGQNQLRQRKERKQLQDPIPDLQPIDIGDLEKQHND